MAYKPLFEAKSRVRIADAGVLRQFMRPDYRYHHPITDEHLEHAGEAHDVLSVGMYHGGDQVYVLDGMPRLVWREECLVTNQLT